MNPPDTCLHYKTCSAPTCPLDPKAAIRVREPGDLKCDLSKHYRTRTWNEMPPERQVLLPHAGLTDREWNARLRLESMTPEEREAMRLKGLALAAGTPRQGSLTVKQGEDAPSTATAGNTGGNEATSASVNGLEVQDA